MEIRRGMCQRCLALSLFLLGPCLRPATAQLLRPEFQINTYTTGVQTSPYSPRVATDSAGNFVVVWSSSVQDGPASSGVFGQRFDSDGNMVGSEFLVNTYTTGTQDTPSVAADASGNFVMVWRDSGQDGDSEGVIGQWFDSAGSKVGSEFQVNSYTTGNQRAPTVTADGAGNFVVVWTSFDQDGSDTGVFGQRYDSVGNSVGSEFSVNGYTTSAQSRGAVAADGSGNFVVVWHSYGQDSSSFGMFGQRFDSAGTKVGSEFQVNSFTTGNQANPSVAVDGSGSFVVVWESRYVEGDTSWGVRGQRFDSAGSQVGSEFQVNSYTTYDQRLPSVAASGSGDFVVVWYSDKQDGSLNGIFAQRYNRLGGTVGSEFQVNSYTTDSQAFPSVAADGSGNFVVTWESLNQDLSNSGLFARLSKWKFADGFESSSICAWSAASGSVDICPP